MILVTGATGKVGSELVKQLSQTGARVRALVRDRERAESLARASNVELAEGDFNDPNSLRDAMKGAERLFLLSAPSREMAEQETAAVEAAKASGVKQIVKLSVIGASASAPFRLGRIHGEVEERIEASGITHTFLRPNGFMQNFLMAAPAVAAQGALFGPDGTTRVSYIDVRDIAAVAAKTLTEDGHEGASYTLTGPEALSCRDVASRLSSTIGKEVNFVEVSLDAVREFMLGAGAGEWTADAVVEIYKFYGEGEASEVTKAVEEVAGKRPVSFEEFARDHAEAFRGAGEQSAV